MERGEARYRVQWIMAPHDPGEKGLVGMTSHAGTDAAAAAIESARRILATLDVTRADRTFIIVGVYGEAGTAASNLLSGAELERKLALYRYPFPCAVVHRPLN